MITTEQLLACGIAPAQASAFTDPLNTAFMNFGITSTEELAAFIGQAMHESANLARLTENLNYTAKRLHEVWPKRFPTLASATPYARNPSALANKVYGGRMGNIAPGDGSRFRGRGIFQLTGRENYRRAGQALGVDLLVSPELVALPEHAALTAGWFWFDKGCTGYLFEGGINAVSRRINGGDAGLEERRANYERCLSVL